MRRFCLGEIIGLCLITCSCKPVKITPDYSGETEVTTRPVTIPIHKDGEPYDTYKGLVMAGYQGWFGTPGDGSQLTAGGAWYHYQLNGQFGPGVLRNSIDFWPDMREYQKKYTVEKTTKSAPFILPDGSHAAVFSSYDEETVMLHFKWMQDYGLDGVWMQRFVSEIRNAKNKDHFDKVLRSAMKASNQYGRAIAVMYDMSGWTTEEALEPIVEDAAALMEEYRLKDRSVQKFYLHENGKPMLGLWGVGLVGNRHPRPSVVKPLIEKLRQQGWSIFLGVPAYWRDGTNDCVSGTEHYVLLNLVSKSDGFFPWMAGRYDASSFTGSSWQKRIEEDIKKANGYSTASHTVSYAAHIFPGFCDRNMYPDHCRGAADATRTGFRKGGKFYWDQFYSNISAGVESIYIGMFDEMDEGTAIFKQLNVSNVPSNTYAGSDYWVGFTSSGGYTMSPTKPSGNFVWCEKAGDLDVVFQGIDDGKDTDWYLWLTGQARKMFRGEAPLTQRLPSR